jgi:hypothetical protein
VVVGNALAAPPGDPNASLVPSQTKRLARGRPVKNDRPRHRICEIRFPECGTGDGERVDRDRLAARATHAPSGTASSGGSRTNASPTPSSCRSSQPVWIIRSLSELLGAVEVAPLAASRLSAW